MKTSQALYLLVTGIFLALQTSCFAEGTTANPATAGGESPPKLEVLVNIVQADNSPEPEAAVDGPLCWFDDGRYSLQFLSGYYPMSGIGASGQPALLVNNGPPPPDRHLGFDLLPIAIRLGWSPHCNVLTDTWFEGRTEALLEYTTDPITRGFGNFVTGPSFLLRYNFERPNCRFVPYIQGGAGMVLDDAYHDMSQRLIGGPHEFLLQAQLGFHYFVNSCWSLDAEAGYVHISNADTYSRNVGINNLGATIGLTYYFGRDGN